MKYVYADTSVIGGCFDNEFKGQSLLLLEKFKTGDLKLILSDLTLEELEPARAEVQNKVTEVHQSNIIEVETTEDVYTLAAAYIHAGALTRKSNYDAMHIALATLNKADVLASWNFKHIVNFDKIKMFNEVNKLFGYQPIKIMTPTLILKTINYEKAETI
jgi:hypothetical protein